VAPRRSAEAERQSLTAKAVARARTSRRTGAFWALVALVAAAAAWIGTAALMRGMDDGPGSDLGSLGFFTATWTLMMAAMMLPVSVPTIFRHSSAQSTRRGSARAALPTVLFVAGYLLAWILVGLVAYAVFNLFKSLDLGALSWDRAGRYVAGGAIVVSALYQLTARKDCCLKACQGHFDKASAEKPTSALAAARDGVRYGVWCVGCCWALFVALFALGVMSVQWMVVIAVLIAAERLLPWRRVARTSIAVLLLLLGIGVAVAPAAVPGLTEPGSMGMGGGGMSMPGGMHMKSGGGMDMKPGGDMQMKPGHGMKPGGDMHMKPGHHMKPGGDMHMKPGHHMKPGRGMHMKPGTEMK
jgi:predicted metal-binding membrane protein